MNELENDQIMGNKFVHYSIRSVFLQLIHSYIWIFWDLLAVGILFHCVRKCAKKGFVSTIIGLLVYIVAAVVAAKTYLWLADFLYDNVIHEAVQHVLVRSFNDMMNGIGSSNDIVHAIPLALRMLIGFKRGEVAAISVTDASDMAGQVIDMALRNPMMSILHGVGFLLVFTLIAYVMRYIARLFIGINHVPVIGTLNTVAGGIAGVLEGLVMLFVSGFILRIIIAVSGEVWWWLNSEVIRNTYIWRLFY